MEGPNWQSTKVVGPLAWKILPNRTTSSNGGLNGLFVRNQKASQQLLNEMVR
jgi:hypothetical protein